MSKILKHTKIQHLFRRPITAIKHELVQRYLSWQLNKKKKNERCAYCGWFLHPQLRLENIERPTKMLPYKVGDVFVCSNCKTNPNA